MAVIHQPHTQRPAVVGPINRCIYGEEHPTDNLSNEHVLPLGLSGGVILGNASCARCRDITSGFERSCLRRNFGLVRAHQSMPTRRPAERPTHGDLYVHDGEKEEVRRVPLSEHPNVLAIPKFSSIPAYITGTPTPPEITMRMFGDPDEIRQKASLHGEGAVSVGGSFDVDAFVRMLAKIGHGMMWASFETEHIRPLLLPIICEGKTAESWHLIGAGFRPLPSFNPGLGAGANFIRCEAVQGRTDRVCIIATIQLFAEWGAPSFTVICGEADRAPPRRMVNQ